MSTLVICADCGEDLDYLEDDEPYMEQEDVCDDCGDPPERCRECGGWGGYGSINACLGCQGMGWV